MTKKLLYSPDFGAGWSTWMTNEGLADFAVHYQPIIDWLESGRKLTDDSPIVEQFRNDAAAFLGLANDDDDFYVCTLGADDLQVFYGDDDTEYEIDEYDGFEHVVPAGTQRSY